MSQSTVLTCAAAKHAMTYLKTYQALQDGVLTMCTPGPTATATVTLHGRCWAWFARCLSRCPSAAPFSPPVYYYLGYWYPSTALQARSRHRQCKPLGPIQQVQQLSLHPTHPVQPTAVLHEFNPRQTRCDKLWGWPGRQHTRAGHCQLARARQ